MPRLIEIFIFEKRGRNKSEGIKSFRIEVHKEVPLLWHPTTNHTTDCNTNFQYSKIRKMILVLEAYSPVNQHPNDTGNSTNCLLGQYNYQRRVMTSADSLAISVFKYAGICDAVFEV